MVLDSAAQLALDKLRGNKKLLRRKRRRKQESDVEILMVGGVAPRRRIEVRGAAEDMPHPLFKQPARRVNVMMTRRDIAAEREKDEHNI